MTRDRSLSAQFEHSVGVTETGVEVFTLSPRGLDRRPSQSAHERRRRAQARPSRRRIISAIATGCASASSNRRRRGAPRLRAARAHLVPRAAAPRCEAARQGACSRRFGSFAETIAAPRERLTEVEGLGEGAATELKIVEAAAKRLAKGEIAERPVLGSWSSAHRLLPHRHGLLGEGELAHPLPRQAATA